MNAFQKCIFTADAVPLYLPQQLYLKPMAQLTITIHLPSKLVGKVISNWELMEKLRSLITPDEYSVLKVSKNTIELIRFHAEIEDKSKLERVINKLDNKLIKLKEFHDLFKIRATEAKLDFPNKHMWDSFFREAKDMNEMKSGERPDTIHISNLPIRWFVPYHLTGEEDLKPSEKIFYRIFEKFGRIRHVDIPICDPYRNKSEKIFYRIFEKFGRIRHVDIPICDPYRNKMKSQLSGLQTFSFDEKDFFEGYVQFKDYGGFVKAMDAFRGMKLLHKDVDFNETSMDAFRGMKLLHKDVDFNETYMVNIKVDFDKTKHMTEGSIRRREIVRESKTKHMTEGSIRRREIVRERLIRKQKEKEQKELLAKEEVRKNQEAERQKELDQKQEKEKRRREREEHRKAKILAQLKIKDADEINDKIAKEEKKLLNAQRKLEAIRLIEELFRRVKNKQEIRGDPDRNFIANDELSKYKKSSEKEFHSRRNSLHHSIAGRVVLKTILSKKVKLRRDSSSSGSSTSQEQRKIDNGNKRVRAEDAPKEYPLIYPQYPQIQNPVYPYFTPVGLPIREQSYFPYHPKSRGFYKGAGPSRGYRRGRGRYNQNYRGHNKNLHYYPPELQAEYYRYFQKFLKEHDDRDTRSYSRSRSRSRSNYRRSRSRRRSYSRSRRSHSRSRSRRSYSRSRSRSRSRQKSRRSSSSHRNRNRSRTRSAKSRSRSRTPKKSRSRSRVSVDSSKFVPPNRTRNKRSRSWSSTSNMNNNKNQQRSWSRSPS
ncbi:hypothetical protein QE152_g7625 [Popillia japonica]|uniref:A-kinase anchor protein 17A n=1 Tax=Popillia japonica TaxID=7064 RepID=A0AAW1MFL0_POPJA